jgi:hypothetical protein
MGFVGIAVSDLGVMFGYEIQRDYGRYQRADKTADR